jgi:hypothetical protein
MMWVDPEVFGRVSYNCGTMSAVEDGKGVTFVTRLSLHRQLLMGR